MASYSDGIKKIRFSIPSNEIVRQKSAVTIDKSGSYKSELPLPGGVYDAHLGTTSLTWKCETCGNKKAKCLGHPGIINLKYPVKSPLFIRQLVAWLKVMCFNCGFPIIKTTSTNIKLTAVKFGNKNKTSPIKCVKCGTYHYHIMVSKVNTMLICKQITYPENKKNIKYEPLYNFDIYDVIHKVPVCIMEQFNSDPRNLLMTSIPVSSNIIRPDTKVSSQEKYGTSDSTTMIKHIVDLDSDMPNASTIRSILRGDTSSKAYRELIKQITSLESEHVYGMIIGGNANKAAKTTSSTNSSQSSYKDEISGKYKLIRKNINGKRTGNTGRGVIVGDPTIKLTEFAIPQVNAEVHFVRETVQLFNKNRLSKLFFNKTYPKILTVTRNGMTYARDANENNFKMITSLQNDDLVERQLIDGDMILANRQPTLHKPSMSGMEVRVMTGKVFRLNPSSCSPFNADYDGGV